MTLQEWNKELGLARPYLRQRIREKAGAEKERCPIKIIEGDSPPKVFGKFLWKTSFTAHNGRFQRTLYTPSSRRVTVGVNWIKKNKAI